MYSRRRRMAAATGRKKTTFNTTKKIAKLISCTTSVPSIDRKDMRSELLLDQRRHDRRNFGDHQQNVERESDRDNRYRLEHADAEKHEEEDIRTCFGLARDRLDRLRGDGSVADR